jgi:hypothetical protein
MTAEEIRNMYQRSAVGGIDPSQLSGYDLYEYNTGRMQGSTPIQNSGSLGSQPFFIPNPGYDLQGRFVGDRGQVPMGGYGTQMSGAIQSFGSSPTTYGTAGQFAGQDPRYFAQYAAPQTMWREQFQAMLNAAEARRQAAQAFMKEKKLDIPETYTEPSLAAAATEAELTKKEGEAMARNIESDFARGGASLSSERNRAMEEARGATSLALRRTRTLAEQEGQKNYQSMMARLLSLIGGGNA